MLKFITEQILRESYKNKPFETFKVESNERLTPGGRQYLIDKKVKIVVEKEYPKEEINKDKINEKLIEKNEIDKNIKVKKVEKIIFYKLKSIEALLFSLVSESIKCNMILAQKILEISRELRDFNKSYKRGRLVEFKIIFQKIEDKSLENYDIYIHNKNAIEIFKLQSILYEICFLEEIIFREREAVEEENIFINNLKYFEGKILGIISELLGGKIDR